MLMRSKMPGFTIQYIHNHVCMAIDRCWTHLRPRCSQSVIVLMWRTTHCRVPHRSVQAHADLYPPSQYMRPVSTGSVHADLYPPGQYMRTCIHRVSTCGRIPHRSVHVSSGMLLIFSTCSVTVNAGGRETRALRGNVAEHC